MTISIFVPAFDVPTFTGARELTKQIVTADLTRDTNGHDPSNNTAYILVDARLFTGNKVLFINNSTDQTVGVNVAVSLDGTSIQALGSSSNVTGHNTSWLDPSNTAALGAYPYPYICVKATFAVTPTTGQLDVWMMLKT